MQYRSPWPGTSRRRRRRAAGAACRAGAPRCSARGSGGRASARNWKHTELWTVNSVRGYLPLGGLRAVQPLVDAGPEGLLAEEHGELVQTHLEIWDMENNQLTSWFLAWLLTLTLFSHGICDKKNWSPRIALLPQLEMWNLQISSWKQLCVIQCWGIDNWVVTTYHTAPPAEMKYSQRSNSCPPVTSLATWRLVIQTNAVFEPIICAFIASAVPGNTLEILHFAGTRLLVPDSVD